MIKYLIPSLLSVIFVCGVFVMPVVVEAQGAAPNTGSSNQTTVTGGGQAPNTGSGNPASNRDTQLLQNPLKFNSITELIDAILDIIAIIAVPIIILFIIISGFKYVMANGNEQKVGEATRALTWAVVGGVIILAASVLIDVIQATVEALK